MYTGPTVWRIFWKDKYRCIINKGYHVLVCHHLAGTEYPFGTKFEPKPHGIVCKQTIDYNTTSIFRIGLLLKYFVYDSDTNNGQVFTHNVIRCIIRYCRWRIAQHVWMTAECVSGRARVNARPCFETFDTRRREKTLKIVVGRDHSKRRKNLCSRSFHFSSHCIIIIILHFLFRLFSKCNAIQRTSPRCTWANKIVEKKII